MYHAVRIKCTFLVDVDNPSIRRMYVETLLAGYKRLFTIVKDYKEQAKPVNAVKARVNEMLQLF